jgi:isopenicillin N synthase-like dioxygenase
MSPSDMPLSKFPPDFDAKWRFFWAIGERPEEVSKDIPKVIPRDFPDWESKMDKWGYMMLNGTRTAAEMAAIGLGLDRNTFTSMMEGGPHLLSPTGSDLNKYGKGTAFASFHYDLNFLTIHGRSRFPGLYIWLRNWTRV